ncbi:MAG: hypothetical protein ABJE47_25345 [bacterium]
MQLWMSTECWHEVADAWRAARAVIEPRVNDMLAGRRYGDGVAKWVYISMISPSGMGLPERNRMDRKARELEFRLLVPYDLFATSDAIGAQRILVASLRRSLGLAANKRIPDFAIADLRRDFDALATAHDWLLAAPCGPVVVEIRGWRNGLQKIKATKLLVSEGGMTLRAAKDATDHVLTGGTVRVPALTMDDAVRLRDVLIAIGLEVHIESTPHVA